MLSRLVSLVVSQDLDHELSYAGLAEDHSLVCSVTFFELLSYLGYLSGGIWLWWVCSWGVGMMWKTMGDVAAEREAARRWALLHLAISMNIEKYETILEPGTKWWEGLSDFCWRRTSCDSLRYSSWYA